MEAPQKQYDLLQKLDEMNEMLRITAANYDATIKLLSECLAILGINYEDKAGTATDTE